MLQRIGDYLKGKEGSAKRKWVTYLFVGVLSVVFAAWGAYGIVNLNFGGSNYAAEANGVKIGLEEVRRTWLQEQARFQEQLRGAELPAELRAQLQEQVLEGMIRDALMAERTHDLGYRVGRAEVLAAIQNAPAFQINGRYSPDAARDALARAGVSLESFQNDLSADLRRNQLENGIRGSDFLTPVELTRLRDLEDQEREVRYLVLSADKFPTPPADEAAVQAYYRAHQGQYLTPESAHLQYAQLRLDVLESQEQVSEADLHAQYDKEKDRLVIPERRRASHILVTGKDDAAARQEAGQVLAQARAGKDFAELARQYSKDPGSARNGGDLGWANRTSFVKPFADALFSMKVGEIRGPVKTQFGYHIIKLDAVQPGKGKTFDEARAQLDTELRRDRATDEFGDIQEKLQSRLQEPNTDLAALAQQFRLQTGDIAQYLRGAGGPPLGPSPPLQEVVFGDPPLAVGHIGGPVLVGDNALVIVKVLEHSKPAPKPLAEVRAGIVAAIQKERGSQAALKAAQSARARLEAGAAFDAVAQSLGVAAEPAHFVGRNDPSIPTDLRSAVFATPRPGTKPVYSALKLPDGGAALIEVARVRTGGAVLSAQELADRAHQQSSRDGMTDVTAYLAEVRRTADVKKNPKAFE